ncbi:MAG: hypothetical protein NXH75_08010 [Halobacteriovoraceae bacterium]|nr:hypothetical protein [Halobacteriovoraceae bacterium]
MYDKILGILLISTFCYLIFKNSKKFYHYRYIVKNRNYIRISLPEFSYLKLKRCKLLEHKEKFNRIFIGMLLIITAIIESGLILQFEEFKRTLLGELRYVKVIKTGDIGSHYLYSHMYIIEFENGKRETIDFPRALQGGEWTEVFIYNNKGVERNFFLNWCFALAIFPLLFFLFIEWIRIYRYNKNAGQIFKTGKKVKSKIVGGFNYHTRRLIYDEEDSRDRRIFFLLPDGKSEALFFVDYRVDENDRRKISELLGTEITVVQGKEGDYLFSKKLSHSFIKG